LDLAGTEADRWTAACAGHRWEIAPPWPPLSHLLEIFWAAEDAGLSPALGDHASSVIARAASLGESLWESIVRAAPPSAAERLETGAIDLRISTGNPLRVAALGLLRSRHGWLGMAPHRTSVEGAGAGEPQLLVLPLRVLLLTSRPYGTDDAPYCGVAHPLAGALARVGIELARVARPRKNSIADVLTSAREAGRPYTALVFDGHGVAGPDGQHIVLESELGPALVGADEFRECLVEAVPPLIVLAACRTARARERENLSTFGQALAHRTGADVVACQYNVNPEVAATFVTALFEELGTGAEVAGAVARARTRLVQNSAALAWSAPVHYRAAQLSFSVEPGAKVLPLPDGVIRHDDCLNVDRGFDTLPAWILLGTPLVGKTHFLQYYAAWDRTRAGARPPPLLLDARAFATPDALVDAHAAAVAVPGRLVLIDAAEHWRDLEPKDCRLFAQRVSAAQPDGVRWLLASRGRLPAIEELEVTQGFLLAFLGRAGLNDDIQLTALCERYFGAACRDDPWMRLLLVSLRCEPLLLEWAGERRRAGADARSTIEAFIEPDPQLLEWLRARLTAEPALDEVDPLLGWTFGLDGRYLMASLATDEAEWESAGREAQASEARALFARAGARGLALEVPGGQWVASATQAVVLRARLPLGEWNPQIRSRYARYFNLLAGVFSLNESGLGETLTRSIDETTLLRGRRGGPLSGSRAAWAALFLQFPAAMTACRLAVEQEQAKDLGDIVSGMARICLEFEAWQACRAWLEHWHRAAANLAVRQAPGADRGLASICEELERLAVFEGRASFVDRARERLAVQADAQSSSIPELLERVLSGFRSADRGAGKAALESLVNTLTMLLGTVGPQRPDEAAIEEVKREVEEFGDAGDRMRMELVLAFSQFQRGAFREGEESLARAARLAEERSPYEQLLVVGSTVELFTMIDHPRAEPLARRGLELARMLGDPYSIGNALLLLAGVYAGRGELEKARDYAFEALPKVRGFTLFHCSALFLIARILMTQGELDVAEAYRARAETEAADTGHLLLRLEALVLAPVIAWMRDLPEEAQRSAERLLGEAAAHGYLHGVGMAHWILGEIAFEADAFERADELGMLATRDIRRLAGEPFLANAWALVAKARYQLDLFDGAADAQREAVRLLEAHGLDGDFLAHQWTMLEMFAGMAEKADIAAEALRKAAEVSPGYRAPPPLLAMLAIGWAKCENLPRAAAYAGSALADPTDINDTLLPILHELTEFLDGHGDVPV
jgi:tetratricopeptide (TPR) repeat protein